MTSVAEKRRRKKAAKITLPGGAEIPQRATQGRRTDLEARPAPETAITARLRISGMSDTPENRKAASDALMGCSVGRRLFAEIQHPKRADLWQAVQHMRRVWAAYDRAIGAPNRHAQCLRILAPSETMTTDGFIFDDRAPADRDRAAVSAWMTLQGWLDYVDRPARSATIAAVVDDQAITNWSGILATLECVNEGIKGLKIMPRFA
jgi:hypothetical protein